MCWSFPRSKRGMDESTTTYPSRVGNRFDSGIKKGVFSSNVTEHQSLAPDDDFLYWYTGAHLATTDTLDWTDIKNSDIVHEDTKGEAINLTHPSIANPLEFSFSLPDLENNARGGSNHASRFSFNRHNYPTFPTVAESNSTSFIHSPGNHQRQSLQEETDCFLSTELVNDKMPTDNQDKLFKGFWMGEPWRTYMVYQYRRTGQSIMEHHLEMPFTCPTCKKVHPGQLSFWTESGKRASCGGNPFHPVYLLVMAIHGPNQIQQREEVHRFSNFLSIKEVALSEKHLKRRGRRDPHNHLVRSRMEKWQHLWSLHGLLWIKEQDGFVWIPYSIFPVLSTKISNK